MSLSSQPSQQKRQKSPLILLSLLTMLTVATLVVASNYFLKPTIEQELKTKLKQNFASMGLLDTNINISGRDVILSGKVKTNNDVIKAGEVAREISGVRDVDNQLVVKNQTLE